MLTVGELVDKLVIENIKLFNLREKLHTEDLLPIEYTETYGKMMALNENRTILYKALDDKLNKISEGEPNRVLKTFKTYDEDRKS